jgi:hypothetical protein
MRPLPKIVLGMLFVLALSSVLVWLPSERALPLPRLPQRQTSATGGTHHDSVEASSWSGPWAQPPVVHVATMVTPTPTPVVVPPLPPVDRTSVRYLGTLVDSQGRTVYLFKYQPLNRVLSLALGEAVDGWILDKIKGREFSLTGPGGLYAAIH